MLGHPSSLIFKSTPYLISGFIFYAPKPSRQKSNPQILLGSVVLISKEFDFNSNNSYKHLVVKAVHRCFKAVYNHRRILEPYQSTAHTVE